MLFRRERPTGCPKDNKRMFFCAQFGAAAKIWREWPPGLEENTTKNIPEIKTPASETAG